MKHGNALFTVCLVSVLICSAGVLSAQVAAIGSDALARFAQKRVPVSDADAEIPGAVKALKDDPFNDESWERLGWLYLQKKDLNKAAECAEKALRLRPFHSRHLLQQTYILLASGTVEGVGRMLARAQQCESVPFNQLNRNDVRTLLNMINPAVLRQRVEDEMNAALKTNTFRMGPTRISVLRKLLKSNTLKQTAYEPGNRYRLWISLEKSFLRTYDWERNILIDHRKGIEPLGVDSSTVQGMAFTAGYAVVIAEGRLFRFNHSSGEWEELQVPEEQKNMTPFLIQGRDYKSVQVYFKTEPEAEKLIYTPGADTWTVSPSSSRYTDTLNGDYGAQQFCLRRTGSEKVKTEKEAEIITTMWYDLADYLYRMGHRVQPPEIIAEDGVLYQQGLHNAALRHGSESSAVYPYIKGMTIPVWNSEDLAGPRSTVLLDSVIEAGVRWVSFTPAGYQNDPLSIGIDADPEWTSSMASLESAIIKAHAKGLKVLLKPHVNLSLEKQDNHIWRGMIRPQSPEAVDAWFEGYTAFLMPYVDLAVRTEVDLMAVGVELKGLHTRTDHWKALIARVREKGFKGKLTYAALHETYDSIGFWKDLDYIGIDAYFGITNTNRPSFSQLINGFKRLSSRLSAFSKGYNRKIIFTEIGYNNLDGCNSRPWFWSGNRAAVDNLEQAACYHAAFEVLPRESWFAGMFWWAWETGDPPYPSAVSYSPQSKLAELILESYYLEKKK